jgi:hypothetical protein
MPKPHSAVAVKKLHFWGKRKSLGRRADGEGQHRTPGLARRLRKRLTGAPQTTMRASVLIDGGTFFGNTPIVAGTNPDTLGRRHGQHNRRRGTYVIA